MRQITLALFVCAAVPAAFAADAAPERTVHWKAADLRAFGPKLAPKMDEKKLALERLGSFGNHSALVAHREADGEAELHETQADLFVVQSGKAALVTGGELVESRTTAPGEVRARAIKSGERRELAPGDVVHIPAKVPHQLLVAKGEEFTYFVLKIDSPR